MWTALGRPFFLPRKEQFYACLTGRADALFELADAVLCADGPVRSLVGLSLMGVHRRGARVAVRGDGAGPAGRGPTADRPVGGAVAAGSGRPTRAGRGHHVLATATRTPRRNGSCATRLGGARTRTS